jgi:hypothetical protein
MVMLSFVNPEAVRQLWLYPANPTRALQFHLQHLALPNYIPAQTSHLLNPALKMVYYFTSNTTSPSAYIYMGKDKVESQ